MAEPDLIAGALAGWQRDMTHFGCVLTLQVAQSQSEFDEGEFQRVIVALNDRQLRSLARDLERAATTRGLKLWGKPRGLRRLFQRRRLPD